jgi:hypothetical protein
LKVCDLTKGEVKGSLSIKRRIKQILVEEEFLDVIAMEKSKDSWQLNELRNLLMSRLAERFENPQFRVSLSQVRRSKDTLSEAGFIKFEDSLTGNRSVIELSRWGLLRELDSILQNEEGDALTEEFDRLAAAQSKKLVIFDRWSYIESQGLKSKVIELMRSFFTHYPKNYYRNSLSDIVKQMMDWGFRTSPKEIESSQIDSLCDHIFLVYNFLPKDEQWYKMLAGDEKLKTSALERFQLYRQEFAVPLEEINRRASFFKD